ncbi:MAG: hypothetical protein WCO51_12345 [bacterium]
MMIAGIDTLDCRTIPFMTTEKKGWIREAIMDWVAKATGDMTLAIAEGKRIVVRVDMLSQNTLKAGDRGERLCRTMNDLTVIANCVNGKATVLPHEDCGLSPLPWQIKRSEKRFAVYDSTGRTICSRSISATNRNRAMADFNALIVAVAYINTNIEL